MSGNIELDKVYDPGVVEPAILELWERNGCFRAVPDERPPDGATSS
jgi:hypothetical protein